MGTRSITVVKDKDGNKIVEMYSQYDGYPDDMGKDLQKFINSGEMVNGLGVATKGIEFNGIHCFAAQLVSHFKGDVAGGYYLYAPSEDSSDKKYYWDKYFAEYYYEIDHNLNIKCWDTIDNKEVILE
jgi:hypothetical protein